MWQLLVGKAYIPFFSWLQDQLWNSLLQLWTLRTNLLKWIGPSHGPVPWKFVEKLFFNKVLISGLILLGKVWTLNLAIARGKGLPFFSWLQDQLWNSLLQLWTLRTNLPKWIGPSHGPVPWKCVEKLFFNQGLISGLIFLGQGEKQDFFRNQFRWFWNKHFFGQKNDTPRFLATIVNLPNNAWVQNNLEKCHNSEPIHKSVSKIMELFHDAASSQWITKRCWMISLQCSVPNQQRV